MFTQNDQVEEGINVIIEAPMATDTEVIVGEGGRISLSAVQLLIVEECDGLKHLLLEKNRKYGNAALDPIQIFSRSNPTEQINVRLDDKLNRIKNRQNDEDEDVEWDLLGYLILKRVAAKLNHAV